MKCGMLLLSSLLVCTGCTTLALKRQTLSQESTPTDIRYQEVLDDLAMVAHDPAALPAYSSVFAGTSQITDTAQLVSTTTIGPKPAQVISPQFSRAALGNWTLDPINAPEKLEAMRGACQWVIYGREFAMRHDWAGVLASPQQAPVPGRHFGVAEPLAKLPQGWLHVGRFRDVPSRGCCKGHSGDTWVWVTSDCIEGLADLCLILQDIARVDINSPTLQYIRPTPTDFVFPTSPELRGMCADPPMVIAEVSVDPCGHLVPDTPYYRWRLENVGSDAALRSQINAAGLH